LHLAAIMARQGAPSMTGPGGGARRPDNGGQCPPYITAKLGMGLEEGVQCAPYFFFMGGGLHPTFFLAGKAFPSPDWEQDTGPIISSFLEFIPRLCQ